MDGKRLRGLVGGAFDRRLETGWTPRIEHPFFLNPRLHEEHEKAFGEFLSAAPVALEIGFGKGLFLVGLARALPGWHVVGLEVKVKLVKAALGRIDKAGLSNARILLGDARELLPRYVRPDSLEALFLLFPDPWWKKKHFKRRMLSPEQLREFAGLLRPGGLFLVRSDVPMVLDLTREAACEVDLLEQVASPGMELPITDRERRYIAKEVPYGEVCYRRRIGESDRGAAGSAGGAGSGKPGGETE